MCTDPPYLDPYLKAVREHGPCFEALLWRNPEYQIARFRVLAEAVPLTGRVLADLGCGRADLADWLHRTGITYGRYFGIEAVPELAAEAARRAVELPEASVLTADFVGDEALFRRLVREHGVDTLVFCGSLNTFEQAGAIEILGRAWQAIRKHTGSALVFNFLSTRTRRPGDPTGPARRFDPAALIDWALQQTPVAQLRHDYLKGHDATIVMRVGGG